MRSWTMFLFALPIVLVLAAGFFIFGNTCAHGGGMGAAYTTCTCAGIEYELYDRTAADGPLRTVCFGVITSRTCFDFMGGSVTSCTADPASGSAIQ